MPGGFANLGQGYLTFAAIKFVGYSCAGYLLNRAYDQSKYFFPIVGPTRTIIGLVFGAAVGVMLLPFALLGPLGLLVYIGVLVPLRLLAWWLIIWCFYDRQTQHRSQDWHYAWYGTGWSFLLDLPAFLGLFSTGGLWIC